jgi:pyruvate formate-lyase/glycerol dehydratase family glycyl radical enzyme
MTVAITGQQQATSRMAPPLADEPLTRPQRYRRLILEAPYEICIERARYYTESYRRTEGQDPALRAAKAFSHTVKNMTLYILDDEAIVGNRSGKLVASIIPVERGEFNLVLDLELEGLLKRPFRPFHLSAEEKRELTEDILPYWTGRTVRDRKKALMRERGLMYFVKVTPWTALDRIRGFGFKALKAQVAQARGNPKLMKQAGEAIAVNNPGLCMNVFDTQGHLVIGHRYLLPQGFAGVKKQAEEKLAGATDPSARAFLEAVVICCDSAREYAARFAELAETKAREATDPGRRQELMAIAARCRRVPWEPPRDFREALQFVWFTHVLALISYGAAAIFALGRFDQYLWPYLKADLAAGRITEDEALELCEELIVKFSYNLLVLPPYGKATGSELGADNMAVTLGGVGADGEDAANPLSYIMLAATENMRSLTNSMSFRVSAKSPDAWVEKIVALHRHCNGPAIFSDEAIVPALTESGYTLEDARDYAIIGCVEPTSDGNTFGCTSGNDVSLAGALEMTLHNGNLRMLGRRLGPRTGDPRRFQTFAELMAAYQRQIRACVELIVGVTKCKDQAYAESYPCVFVSSTLNGCVANARDATRGGAQYNFDSVSARGLATAADSLLAIKKFVYEEKSVSMGELIKALDWNWRGKEQLRQRLRTRPAKFGQDDDEADALAREIAEYFCREVMKHTTDRGGTFRPSFFGYGLHVFEGTVLGATPDGRRAGEPISNSLSPTNQAEKKGPVAALNSVARINHRLIPNGASTNVRLLPTVLASETGVKKVAAMLRAYFKQGGQQVQFNVVSDDVLRRAQQHPDEYKDLVVRVSGYSAYFVDLGKPVQDDIINRLSFENV